MRMPERVRMFVMKIFWQSLGPGTEPQDLQSLAGNTLPDLHGSPPYRAADGSMYWLSNCLSQMGRL